MTIKARLSRLEREALKRNITGQVRRVHYVAVYGQGPGDTGPPEIACEFDRMEPAQGPEVLRFDYKK